jgi:7-cyano-7-deazaguanine synthase in queuosine biosynthesis
MNKKILLALSGGFDSTYLLIKNLQEGNRVKPIYIYAYNVHPAKRLIEITTVKKLIKTLQKKFDNLDDLEEVLNKQHCINGIISTQPIMWLLGLFEEVKKENYTFYDEVQIAYIMGDTAVSFQNELQAFWKSFFAFSYPVTETDKYPKLVFPLIKYSKDLVLNELRHYDYSIVNNCWTCEAPKYIIKKPTKSIEKIIYIEPCGTCHTCTNLKNAKTFTTIKRYKATFNADKFKKDHNSIVNKIINEIDIFHIQSEYFSLEETDYKIPDKTPEKKKPYRRRK